MYVHSNESCSEQYFPKVVLIAVCKVVLTFESVDEPLKSATIFVDK